MYELPEQLLKKQELQRQTTINQVMRAIHDLREEGYETKIKDLMEYTGLSRAVFAKPHIRELLIQAGMVPDNSTQEISCKGSKKATQVSNLKQKLAQKEERIQKLVAENGKLKEECALLRGRLHLLMQLHSKK